MQQLRASRSTCEQIPWAPSNFAGILYASLYTLPSRLSDPIDLLAHGLTSTMASLGGNNPIQHPLQATASAIGSSGGDPRGNRASHFMSANEGPAEIAAKISGVNLGGKREDDSEYFTNNEGIPWPDPWASSDLSLSTAADLDIEPIARPSAGFPWSAIHSLCRNSRLSTGPRIWSVRTSVMMSSHSIDMTSRLRKKRLTSFRDGAPLRKRCLRLFFVHQKHVWTHVCRTLTQYLHGRNLRRLIQWLCRKANFLQSAGQKTPIFIRFSTVTLGREFPDSARNPRGFAIKFYTGEGNYDIVGLNWVRTSTMMKLWKQDCWRIQPIFFCRDPIQGPDVIRSQARNPQNFFLDYDATFDLLACTPEGCVPDDLLVPLEYWTDSMQQSCWVDVL